MPSQTWTLTDVAHGIRQDNFCITPDDLPGAAGNWKISQRVLHGGLSEGVDLVEIENGRMRLMVLPTRGMGIWRAETGDGQTLGWRSPVRGPVHPSFVPLHDPSGLGWLEGFDELVVRCGMESNGAPDFDAQGKLLYPLHGRIANRPAHYVEATVDERAGTITLRGFVEETRFHFQKLRLEASVTMSLDSMAFTICDRVENYGGTAAEMQMLYHINVGEPQLGAGAQLVAPVQAVTAGGAAEPGDTKDWDTYGPPVPGGAEQLYHLGLLGDEAGRTRVLLKNGDGTAGTVIGLNTNQLPCFTLWKNSVASDDGYVTGLEPATNLPNSRSSEAELGRVISLAPGETWSAEVTVDWLTQAHEVEAAENAIRKLQDQAGPD
jgi:hypothetical protein